MIIVYGAAGSGKSKVAENIITSLARKGKGKLFYLATMENESDAAKERISRHLKLREGKGFITIEEAYDLSQHISEIKNQYVLVEDVSNLLANVYFSERKNNIFDQFVKIDKEAKTVVVVANNIFEEGPSDDKVTEDYLKELAKLNNELAKLADTFVEVVCGQENILKGERIWQS